MEIPLASFGEDAELLRRPTLVERIAAKIRENERSETPGSGMGIDLDVHTGNPN